MVPSSIEYITLSFLDNSLDHFPDNSCFKASGLANPEKKFQLWVVKFV
jgi:hypothetical protein